MNGTIWAELDDQRDQYALRGATYDARLWIKRYGTWHPDEKVWRVPRGGMQALAEELRAKGFRVTRGKPRRPSGGNVAEMAARLGLLDDGNEHLPKQIEIDPEFIRHRAEIVEAYGNGWADRVESERIVPGGARDGQWIQGLVDAFRADDEALQLVLWMIRKKIGDIGVGDEKFPLGDAAAVDTEIQRLERRMQAERARSDESESM